MLTYFNVLYPLPVTSTEQVLFLEATSAWVCGSMSLFVPKMVRLTSSKDQNVPIPGVDMSAVPPTADFFCLT